MGDGAGFIGVLSMFRLVLLWISSTVAANIRLNVLGFMCSVSTRMSFGGLLCVCINSVTRLLASNTWGMVLILLTLR